METKKGRLQQQTFAAGGTMDWDWAMRYFMAGQQLRKSAAEEKVPTFTFMSTPHPFLPFSPRDH